MKEAAEEALDKMKDLPKCIICETFLNTQEATAGWKRCETCDKPCPYCGKKIKPSYTHARPFCTQTCGLRFGMASFRAGYRMVRK